MPFEVIKIKKITKEILPSIIKPRNPNSFKGTYGKVCLIGGNNNMGGAVIMATLGTVYSGAGLTTTITNSLNQSSLHAWTPEAMFADISDLNQLVKLVKKSTVVAIGSGLGTSDNSLETVKTTFATIQANQILIVDGSAIDLIAKYNLILPKCKLIFTPHKVEWEKLSGLSLDKQTPENNKKAQQKLNAIVVVKSHRTEVYTNSGNYQNTVGTPAQATGGMGDTLAGMISGFVAQFPDLEKAVLAAVYSHSAIADEISKEQYVVLPHQISKALPHFMKEHESKL